VALLAVLMLRGPQTAAELRLNAERLHRFADISSVEGFLDELAGKELPRVVKLARSPGEREARWVQLLTGPSTGSGRAEEGGEGPSTGSGRTEVPEPGPSTGSGRTEGVAAGLRFVLPEGALRVHEMVMPLRWGDMDAMGHVNNTLYFRYMEVCRLDWIFSVGVDPKLSTAGPVIINAFCNFLRQLEFPGDIRVTMSVANPGRSSFDTFHTIERVDQPGVVYAEGGARTVWTDYAAKRSAPMPDWFRARLTE
jgi:acyl-CoA thioester hydrolase